MRVAYIVISGLVVCSMIAVAIATVDVSGLWSDGDDESIMDPNADLVAEQQTVVAQSPEDVNEIVLLANLLSNTGRMGEATEWYERALELAPQDHGIRLDFARSLQTNGLNADAEAQFLLVLDADSDNLSGHYYLAQLYMDWKPQRRAEAREHFERVVEINPESFLAEQARVELDSMNQTTPVASPGASTPVAGP
jgi:cytochrome c-type biogenesis protein CcmH/NrfG